MRDRLNSDPLAAIVALLRPRTILSKFISGSGRWAVQYPDYGQPSFCFMTTGSCWLSITQKEPFLMAAGDFLLLPATPGFRMGSDIQALQNPTVGAAEVSGAGEMRHGALDLAPAVRMLGGYFVFDPTNAPLLVSLLPDVIHIKATDASSSRLGWIARAIGEETAASRPGADAILVRLVEVMLIEALRWRPEGDGEAAPVSGLLAGLADARLAIALRHVHEDVAQKWTIESLALKAGMSRAAFAARFARVLGIAPMEYVSRWRMALAKELLWHDRLSLGEVAHAVGYHSASAFSTAFSRTVGISPSAFAREGELPASNGGGPC